MDAKSTSYTVPRPDPQGLAPTNTPTFVSAFLTTLTASRLVASDANKKLVSTGLLPYVTGTTNRVTVADNGSGGVVLSAPQNLHTGAVMTLAGQNLVSINTTAPLSMQRTQAGVPYRYDQILGSGGDLFFVRYPGGVATYDVSLLHDRAVLVIGAAGTSTGNGMIAVKTITPPSGGGVGSVYLYGKTDGVRVVPTLKDESGNEYKFTRHAHVPDPTDLATCITALTSINATLETMGVHATS